MLSFWSFDPWIILTFGFKSRPSWQSWNWNCHLKICTFQVGPRNQRNPIWWFVDFTELTKHFGFLPPPYPTHRKLILELMGLEIIEWYWMNSYEFLFIFTFLLPSHFAKSFAQGQQSWRGAVHFHDIIGCHKFDKHGIWMCDSVYVNPILSQSKSIPMNGDIIIIIT